MDTSVFNFFMDQEHQKCSLRGIDQAGQQTWKPCFANVSFCFILKETEWLFLMFRHHFQVIFFSVGVPFLCRLCVARVPVPCSHVIYALFPAPSAFLGSFRRSFTAFLLLFLLRKFSSLPLFFSSSYFSASCSFFLSDFLRKKGRAP